MDESYLQWLSSLPGLRPDVAQRIAERFPTYDHLRAASREELASVEGLDSQGLEALSRVLGDRSGRDEAGQLYLCPECGSFAGMGASACPFCGAEFESGQESEISKDLAQFLRDEESPARICQTCGAAMGNDDTACRVCGRTYRPDELALLPGHAANLEETSPLCGRCGAYLFSDESDCTICGTPLSGVPTSEAIGSPKGVVKDFLTRWQRMAQEGAVVSEADRLEEELDHYDRLLEADATLERAWANRSKVLEKLGRSKEAVESLAKAAEMNPARDEQYRLEVQNILRTTSDVPVLPPRWRQPAATAVRPPPDSRLLEALDHYESLLRVDPSLVVAWRTKAEILDRLGRAEESRSALERADALGRKDDHSIQAGVAGLHSNGLATPGPTGAGRVNGRVNGVRGGQTNGHTNGRTNGRVNGLAEGRVNGLTTGAVNGLTFGRGATNGLVNGNGFTNGRRGRPTPLRIPPTPHWSRSVVGIAAVVALMVIVPILASMLSPFPGGPASRIQIDGDFSDWTAVPAFVDSASDQGQNPAVNLVAFKAVAEGSNLYVNVRVQSLLFRGVGPNETDSIFVFVDEDADRSTGYPIGDLGADSVTEAFGWLNLGVVEHGVTPLRFDLSGAPRSNDWSRFSVSGSTDAAFNGQDLEMRMTVRDPDRARLLVYAADNQGNTDPGDGSVRTSRPALVVHQTTIAPDVATSRTAFLRVTIAPLGGSPHLGAINVSRSGNSTDLVDVSLYRDDGSGTLDSGDLPLSTLGMAGQTASLPADVILTSSTVLWLEVAWPNATPESTFGLTVTGVTSNGSVSFHPPETGLVHQVRPPPALQVDGAFGDWNGRPFGLDPLGDVTNRTGAPRYSANVDLIATAVELNSNLTGYVRVDGRILGGENIPTSRTRTYPSAVDTDLDSVPDWVETGLGPTLALDFSNDNVTDAQSGIDLDSDQLMDYPHGVDCWLNTTIPGWYPHPYADRFISRYACPIGQPPREGFDAVYAFIDADNRTATGLFSHLEGEAFGFRFRVAVNGRNAVVNSSGLYAFAPGSADPWQFVRDVPVAHDAHRLEFATDAGGLNLAADYRIIYQAATWRFDSDSGSPNSTAGLSPSPVQAKFAGDAMPALRRAGGPDALDISAGETFWLLDAGHGTETACTTNKVASTNPGGGPVASLTLHPGESACWYLDEAAGQSIPEGTWETLLDLVLAHGVAAYGEESLNTPRYRVWEGSFAPEGSGPPTAVVPEWVVLAASPLGPEMILGVLASNQVLYVQTWDGSAWTPNWNANLGDSKTRRFDIAYEERSGDVVVAFADGTSQLRYRGRVGGTWSAQNLNAGSPLSDTAFTIRASARPTNDDIFIAVVTNAQTLHALRWDGATNGWVDQVQMGANVPVASKDQEAFDVAFERSTGAAWLFWGTEASTLRYRRYTTSWQAEAVAYTLPDKPLWVVADSDPRPGTGNIAVGITLANNNLEFGAWDGGQWVSRPSAVTARDKVQRGIDVAFEATTGRAVFAFNTVANAFQLSTRTWTAAGGFSSVSVQPGSVANIAIVQLRSDPRSDDILALYSDEDKDLYHRLWDGTTWSALGLPLETTLSIHKDKEAFAFAWTRAVEYDVYFEIWNTTTNSVASVVGSCVDQTSYGDDIVCSIAGVPAMTLAPDQVVRIRVSHSSPGGTIGLRYHMGGSSGTGDSRVLLAIPELGEILFVVAVPVLILWVRRRLRQKEKGVADSVPWIDDR